MSWFQKKQTKKKCVGKPNHLSHNDTEIDKGLEGMFLEKAEKRFYLR